MESCGQALSDAAAREQLCGRRPRPAHAGPHEPADERREVLARTGTHSVERRARQWPRVHQHCGLGHRYREGRVATRVRHVLSKPTTWHSLSRGPRHRPLARAAARRAARRHGRSTSEGPGWGSEFVVRLPITAAPAADSPGSTHATLEPASGASGTRERVLIVDDNADGANSLGRLLASLGHQTAMAYDGQAALDRAEVFAADIVLLDLGMLGLDGFEICRRLRASDSPHRPRIVAMTGWGREGDRARTAAAGFDAHLVKPVDVATLARLLEEPVSSNLS